MYVFLKTASEIKRSLKQYCFKVPFNYFLEIKHTVVSRNSITRLSSLAQDRRKLSAVAAMACCDIL